MKKLDNITHLFIKKLSFEVAQFNSLVKEIEEKYNISLTYLREVPITDDTTLWFIMKPLLNDIAEAFDLYHYYSFIHNRIRLLTFDIRHLPKSNNLKTIIFITDTNKDTVYEQICKIYEDIY